MKTKTLLFIALSSFILGSCFDWDDCIDGNGDFTSESRNVDYFNKIEVDGSFDVIVTQGNNTSVTVEADENLMGYILTKTSGGRLTISTRRDRCFNSYHQVTVYVTTPELNDINLSGSGNIECDQIESPELYVNLAGSGSIFIDYLTTDHTDIMIEGSGYVDCFSDTHTADLAVEGSGEIRMGGIADEAEMVVSGSGRIRANEMDVLDCYATITGSGDIYTTVSHLLDAKITGSGTIYYYGDPEQILKTITGSGNVVKRN